MLRPLGIFMYVATYSLTADSVSSTITLTGTQRLRVHVSSVTASTKQAEFFVEGSIDGSNWTPLGPPTETGVPKPGRFYAAQGTQFVVDSMGFLYARMTATSASGVTAATVQVNPFDLAAKAATPYESMLPVKPGKLIFGPRMAPNYASIATGGGSLAYDPAIVAPGETQGCLKFTAGGAAGIQAFDFDVSHVDINGGNISFWVYMPSRDAAVQNTSAVEVLLTSDVAFAHYFTGSITRAGLKDGWAYVQLTAKTGVHFAVSAGSPTWGEFPKMRFRFNGAAAGSVIWIGPMYYERTPKAAVAITIDDMSTNARDVLFPLLRARGLRATGYVNKAMTEHTGDYAGSTFYADVADLIAAKDILEYGSHAGTHQAVGSRSFATWKQDEWEASMDYMLAQGLIAEADLEWLTAAYPLGDTGGATTTVGLESAAAAGIKAAYVVALGTTGANLPGHGCSYRQHFDQNCAPVGSNTALNLPRFTVGGTGAAPFDPAGFDTALQRAKDTDSVLTLMFHHVERGAGNYNLSTDVTLAHATYVLDAVAAAAAAGDIEITTPTRLVKEATLWRRAHPGRA